MRTPERMGRMQYGSTVKSFDHILATSVAFLLCV